jgi:hypothetical protein
MPEHYPSNARALPEQCPSITRAMPKAGAVLAANGQVPLLDVVARSGHPVRFIEDLVAPLPAPNPPFDAAIVSGAIWNDLIRLSQVLPQNNIYFLRF